MIEIDASFGEGGGQAAAGEKSGNEASPDLPGKFEPTGAWSTIKKVKASDYPEFDAVVLSQRLVCSLGSNPALSTEQGIYPGANPGGQERGRLRYLLCPAARGDRVRGL